MAMSIVGLFCKPVGIMIFHHHTYVQVSYRLERQAVQLSLTLVATLSAAHIPGQVKEQSLPFQAVCSVEIECHLDFVMNQ